MAPCCRSLQHTALPPAADYRISIHTNRPLRQRSAGISRTAHPFKEGSHRDPSLYNIFPTLMHRCLHADNAENCDEVIYQGQGFWSAGEECMQKRCSGRMCGGLPLGVLRHRPQTVPSPSLCVASLVAGTAAARSCLAHSSDLPLTTYNKM